MDDEFRFSIEDFKRSHYMVISLGIVVNAMELLLFSFLWLLSTVQMFKR